MAGLDIDLKSLRAFIEVGQTLSFTAAAAKLNSSQPRISSRIQVLEDRLGFRLFERSGKGVRFTSEGERLFDYACRAVEQVELLAAAADELLQDTSQRFQIGASPLFTAERWSIIDRFLARYPKALPRVSVAPAPVLLHQLRRKDIDLAFIVGEVPAGVEAHVLWTTRFGIVFAPGSLGEIGDEILIEQLAGREIYMFPREASPDLYAHLEALLGPIGVSLIDQVEGNSESIALHVAQFGRLVISPRWWPNDTPSPPGIDFRPIEGIPDAVSFSLVRNSASLVRTARLLWEMVVADD